MDPLIFKKFIEDELLKNNLHGHIVILDPEKWVLKKYILKVFNYNDIYCFLNKGTYKYQSKIVSRRIPNDILHYEYLKELQNDKKIYIYINSIGLFAIFLAGENIISFKNFIRSTLLKNINSYSLYLLKEQIKYP